MNSVIAIGCDGTAVNTGTKGGIVKLLEKLLDRPLHWFICMLHANELPLRHLLEELDGKTSGPRGFRGPIGKQLQKCETLPILPFVSIPACLDHIETEELSTDQKYLYEMHKAVSEGVLSRALASRSPGNLSHARWLTTANRILRVYVATEAPTDNLYRLVYFIMTVYAPMWFSIKTHPYVQHGAKHVFETVLLVKKQDERIQSIVMPVVQRNAYFAHPESVLLCMISDERPHIRELGWRRIKNVRATCRASSSNVRSFKVPKLNTNCNDYMELINWHTTEITEPPLTKAISDDDVDQYIRNKNMYVPEKYPLHTQAVERIIKLVTDASSQVCSHEAREGFICTRLASRERHSSFESKKDSLEQSSILIINASS